VDDLTAKAVGYAGQFSFLKTPNLDRLAREGVVFENAFVTTSLCSPSRACFLTGCHAHRHGVRRNDGHDPDPAIPTFPQVLRQSGYETAFIGKWHMAETSAPRPGFDYWLSFRGQGEYNNPLLNENGREFKSEGYVTDLLTDYAVRWLEQPHEKPFCLLLWHKAVHADFIPATRHAGALADISLPKPLNFDDTFEGKPEWQRRLFAKRRDNKNAKTDSESEAPSSIPPGKWNGREPHYLSYVRTILGVDESLGAIRAALEKKGVLDNTVIVFSSDNGYFLGEHRLGDKRLAYEEAIRIPLVFRYPEVAVPGGGRSQFALNIDIAPTLLDLVGARTPRSMQGISLASALKRPDARGRDAFLYAYYQEPAHPSVPTMLAVRGKRWKYISYPELTGPVEELYDLEADPYELRNLSTDPAHEQDLARGRANLRQLLKKNRVATKLQVNVD
jgi:N-acetylglucosamine-6-sulfatase